MALTFLSCRDNLPPLRRVNISQCDPEDKKRVRVSVTCKRKYAAHFLHYIREWNSEHGVKFTCINHFNYWSSPISMNTSNHIRRHSMNLRLHRCNWLSKRTNASGVHYLFSYFCQFSALITLIICGRLRERLKRLFELVMTKTSIMSNATSPVRLSNTHATLLSLLWAYQ